MSGNESLRSLLLAAPPSFATGAGSAFDLFGEGFTFNESLSNSQADHLAARADWRAVGDSIRDSIAQVKRELKAR